MQVNFSAKQAIQGRDVFQLNYSVDITAGNKSKVVGTMLHELFEFMKLAKKHKAKKFLSNDVTDIKISFGDIALDTEAIKFVGTDYAKTLRARMRLRSSNEGFRSFASLFMDLCDYMTRAKYEISFEELIETLEIDADIDRIAKAALLN